MKAVVDGKLTYKFNDETPWEPALVCDGCFQEIEITSGHSEGVSITVNTILDKTVGYDRAFDLHPQCFEALIERMKEVNRNGREACRRTR